MTAATENAEQWSPPRADLTADERAAWQVLLGLFENYDASLSAAQSAVETAFAELRIVRQDLAGRIAQARKALGLPSPDDTASAADGDQPPAGTEGPAQVQDAAE